MAPVDCDSRQLYFMKSWDWRSDTLQVMKCITSLSLYSCFILQSNYLPPSQPWTCPKLGGFSSNTSESVIPRLCDCVCCHVTFNSGVKCIVGYKGFTFQSLCCSGKPGCIWRIWNSLVLLLWCNQSSNAASELGHSVNTVHGVVMHHRIL